MSTKGEGEVTLCQMSIHQCQLDTTCSGCIADEYHCLQAPIMMNYMDVHKYLLFGRWQYEVGIQFNLMFTNISFYDPINANQSLWLCTYITPHVQVQSYIWSPWNELCSIQTRPTEARGWATAEATEHVQTGCRGNRCGGEQGRDASEQLDIDQLCDIVGGAPERGQTNHHHVGHTGTTAATCTSSN